MPPSFLEYPVYAGQLLNGFRTMHEAFYAELRRQDTKSLLHKDARLRILDLGNGRLRPQYMLLKASGHNVFGIDLVNRRGLSVVNSLYGVARSLYAWRSRLRNRSVLEETLVCGDVAMLPFRSNTFDLITSVAAFEHFIDVPVVVEDAKRVLRVGGLMWVCIHLFTCPSGAHNVTFTQIPLKRMPRKTDAWDHLRQGRLPIDVPLNKWRRDQYLKTFKEHFEILKHYCAIREGAELLKPDVARELANYSSEELTCHSYVILAQKTK